MGFPNSKAKVQKYIRFTTFYHVMHVAGRKNFATDIRSILELNPEKRIELNFREDKTRPEIMET